MTIEEKREKIRRLCIPRMTCVGCGLHGKNNCWDDDTSDERVEENYKILFDDEERIEQNKKPMNVSIEDADTMIVIKSNRKIDNITIYFKED